MKKRNGFVFVETMVTVVILSTALLVIYSLFNNILIKEHRKAYFDDPLYVYRTNYLTLIFEEIIKDASTTENNPGNYINFSELLTAYENGNRVTSKLRVFTCNNDIFNKNLAAKANCQQFFINNQIYRIYISTYDLSYIDECAMNNGVGAQCNYYNGLNKQAKLYFKQLPYVRNGNGYYIIFEFYDNGKDGVCSNDKCMHQFGSVKYGGITNIVDQNTMVDEENDVIVTFNANGGSVSGGQRHVTKGQRVGDLPKPTKSGVVFDGWYTLQDGGRKIDKNEVIRGTSTFYAHWASNVAEINGTFFSSINTAYSSINNSDQTTIIVHADTSEYLIIGSSRNIILDLQGHTVSNKNDKKSIFENSGTLEIKNGILTSNGTAGAVNNDPTGTLQITDLSIIATNTRQALYNKTGTTTISGDSYLSASSSERAALHNLDNGTVYLQSGTVISTGQNAIENAGGTMVIGTQDGVIAANSPLIIGNGNAIKNSGTYTLYFYDGILKSIGNILQGSITGKQEPSSYVDTTEDIDDATYNVKYLRSN